MLSASQADCITGSAVLPLCVRYPSDRDSGQIGLVSENTQKRMNAVLLNCWFYVFNKLENVLLLKWQSV
jgi:hypothetical protein